MSLVTTTNNHKQKENTAMETSNQTQHHGIIRTCLALALALAIWSPVQAQSAEPAKEKTAIQEKMMEHCQAMQEQKQKLHEDMKAQDAELTDLVAKMNSAPEDKKMGLMATVLTRMVEQRVEMNERKAKMEEEMMQHMMQHMQMGKESVVQCPMMKGMKGMDEKPAGAHKEHQEKQK